MSSFINHSKIEAHWKQWKNLESFRFYHNDNKLWIYDEIEAWFIFDWCSVPFCLFWQKIEPDTLTPCCYHDWLVKYKRYWYWKSNYLFLVSMRINWTSTWKKIRYYLWVTLWCWITWYFTWETAIIKKYFK
jgi:hypothetical protein